MSHSPGARSRCLAPSAVKLMVTSWDDQDVHDKPCGRNMFPLNHPLPSFIFSPIFPFFLRRSFNSFMLGPTESSSFAGFSSSPLSTKLSRQSSCCIFGMKQRFENGLAWAARWMYGSNYFKWLSSLLFMHVCYLCFSIYFYMNIHAHTHEKQRKKKALNHCNWLIKNICSPSRSVLGWSPDCTLQPDSLNWCAIKQFILHTGTLQAHATLNANALPHHSDCAEWASLIISCVQLCVLLITKSRIYSVPSA